MKKIIIYCGQIRTTETLHDLLADAFSFPDYYGKNLDALYDCLTEFGCDTHLKLINFAALKSALGSYAEDVALVLRDAHEEEPSFTYTIN